MKNHKPVILGLGNPLFQDEGVGVHIIQRLMREDIEEEVQLIDGGTDGLALLGVIEEAQQLIIIDAVDGSRPPGTVFKLQDSEIPLLVSGRLSPHQIGLQEIMALARLRGRQPEQMVLIGVQPQSLEWGTQPTRKITALIPQMLDLIYIQLRQWGVTLPEG